MRITRDELENLKYKDVINKIKDAVNSEDKEFIMSVIPIYDYFIEEAGEIGEDIYEDFIYLLEDSKLFEDKSIALELAKYGYEVPKELYENDEEVILTTIKSGNALGGFDLASNSLMNNKDFLINMISNIEDVITLNDLLCEIRLDKGYSVFPEQVLHDGTIEQFITAKINEVKEKERSSNEEETPSSPSNNGKTSKDVAKDEIETNATKMTTKVDAIKRAIIGRIIKKRRKIDLERNKIKANNKVL